MWPRTTAMIEIERKVAPRSGDQLGTHQDRAVIALGAVRFVADNTVCLFEHGGKRKVHDVGSDPTRPVAGKIKTGVP